MAPHTVRRRAGPVRASGARARLGPLADDLVIVNRALTDLAEFLQPRQEAAGRGRVIVDRRLGERRRAPRVVKQDRRQSDRRRDPPNSIEALMRVLGFMVVPTPASSDGPSSRRPAKRPVPASRALGRPQSAGRRRRSRSGRS
jgi:hypothetical protein